MKFLVVVFGVEVVYFMLKELIMFDILIFFFVDKCVFGYVCDIKVWYFYFILYFVIMLILVVLNYFVFLDSVWVIWFVIGWGFGVVFYGLIIFEVFGLFSLFWEKC